VPGIDGKIDGGKKTTGTRPAPTGITIITTHKPKNGGEKLKQWRNILFYKGVL
jgi:hypothetical protein